MPAGANYAGAHGLMQVTPDSMGANRYNFARMDTDPAYSIYAGVCDLALRYADSDGLPWANVAVGYFSGHYYPNGASDAYNSDVAYMQQFEHHMSVLEAAAQAAVQDAPEALFPGIGAIWGNIPSSISQEYGPTYFSVYVQPGWYAYALEYGFTEPGHTGLDVAIPQNTQLYAPMDGTVICAGTGNGTRSGEDSCTHFESENGGWTSGRLQLKLTNGDMLILGHVNSSSVVPGQEVRAGEPIGLSGSMNGPHVHVEYRVRDCCTLSGWRLVNPSDIFGAGDPGSSPLSS
jgi:murein DD-endopeptidase MepM/ murein hydrolase activator NlpD